MAAPKAHIKVSGTYKQVQKMHVKVSGSWKRVNNAYVRVSGAWKKFLQSVVASSFDGLFATVGSTSTVTSASRQYTLGAGNSGQVRFENIVNTGIGNLRYNVNSAGNNNVSEGTTITLANLDNMVMSATGLASGNSITFDVVDVDTGTVLENDAVLARS